MLSGTRARLVLVAAVLCAGCGPRRATPQAGKQLYPFQKEVEARLQGRLEEKEHYAALLPLMLRIRLPKDDGLTERPSFDKYLREFASYVAREKPPEAIPLLEKLLRVDNHVIDKHLHGVSKKYLAQLYIDMSSAGMTQEMKAKFLADLIIPAKKMAAWEEAERRLTSLGNAGRQAVLDVVRREKGALPADDAALQCAMAVSHTLTVDGEELKEWTEAEIKELLTLAEKSDFGQLVTAAILAAQGVGGDPRCIKLFEKLWDKYPPPKAGRRVSSVRAHMLAYYPGIVAIRGGDKLILKMLKDLDGEQPNKGAERNRSRILGMLSDAQRWKKTFRLAPEMKRYLTTFAGRPLAIPKNPAKNPGLLSVAHEFVLNQEKARQVLKSSKATQR